MNQLYVRVYPLLVIAEPSVQFLVVGSLVTYFTHSSVYMSSPISQFIPLPFSQLGVCTFVLCVYVSISAFQIGTSVPFFQIPHICIYIWYFSLSDALHSAWQSLGPSMSLQMAQLCSFLWLSNIPCIYVPYFLYPFLSWWAFRLLLCFGYCK